MFIVGEPTVRQPPLLPAKPFTERQSTLIQPEPPWQAMHIGDSQLNWLFKNVSSQTTKPEAEKEP